MPEAPTVRAALARGAAALGHSDSPQTDASLLLCHCVGLDRAALIAHGERPVDPIQFSRFMAACERAAAGEPLAYVLGTQAFWTLELEVTPDTLIPRPDTETLVEQALARMPTDTPLHVLDLGTGSGAIAIAIAAERPDSTVTATDISAETLLVAKRNAARAGVSIHFIESDWFSALTPPPSGTAFDLIVSNPPYIAEGDPHLDAVALRHEPQRALVSGPDGLDAARTLISHAPAWLAPHGWLLLEHGYDQAAAVTGLLSTHRFESVSTTHDLGGNPRVAAGQYGGTAA